jgi:hypothetical protein
MPSDRLCAWPGSAEAKNCVTGDASDWHRNPTVRRMSIMHLPIHRKCQKPSATAIHSAFVEVLRRCSKEGGRGHAARSWPIGAHHCAGGGKSGTARNALGRSRVAAARLAVVPRCGHPTAFRPSHPSRGNTFIRWPQPRFRRRYRFPRRPAVLPATF